MKYLYLIVDLATISVPFIFSFHPRIAFYKHYKAVLLAITLPAIGFLAWDMLYTAKGVWGFNPEYLMGIYFFNLPIEEVLFFICIPYACLFTYFCLTSFYELNWSVTLQKTVATLLAAILLVTGGYHIDRLYPSATFIGVGILLLLLVYVFKVRWMGRLLTVYAVLFIPFCIVNGILTGTGLDKPVVWYNDLENLGLRLHTIPVEDVFYGLEFVLLNTFIFEIFKRKLSSAD